MPHESVHVKSSSHFAVFGRVDKAVVFGGGEEGKQVAWGAVLWVLVFCIVQSCTWDQKEFWFDMPDS